MLYHFPSIVAFPELQRRSSDGEDALASLVEPTVCRRQTEDGGELCFVYIEFLFQLFDVQTTAWVRRACKEVNHASLDSDIEGCGPIDAVYLLESTLIWVLNENLETTLRNGLGSWCVQQR